MKNYFFLFIFILNSSCFGMISLQINCIQKKEIDDGLVLENEVHLIKSFSKNELFQLQLKEGLNFNLSASFAGDRESYGPSSKVAISGTLYNENGIELYHLKKADRLLELGESKTFTYLGENGQSIDLTLQPSLK